MNKDDIIYWYIDSINSYGSAILQGENYYNNTAKRGIYSSTDIVISLKDFNSKDTKFKKSKSAAKFWWLINELKSLKNTVEITENKLTTYKNKANKIVNSNEFIELSEKYPDMLI